MECLPSWFDFLALGFFVSYDLGSVNREAEILMSLLQAFEPGTVNERLRCLFGPNWALNFICPQPWFKNQLGVEFKQNIYAACTKEL